MKILGISAFYHDSAAAIIHNDRVVAAAQEERFTRKKHDPSFPTRAVSFCLEESGFSLDELDAIVFYDKPWLKFERLLDTYYVNTPKGLKSFLLAMPIWVKEKIFLRKIIIDELNKIQKFNTKNIKLLFSEHHLSHAASTYYTSPYNDSAILTIDGVGEWATASICHGQGKQIKVLKEIKFPDSVGFLYSAFTYYLGLRVNSGEYKLMGLAPYGHPGSDQVKKFIKLILENIVTINDDGSIHLHQEFFDYAVGSKMTNEAAWEKLFGFARRVPESAIKQHHCDMALAIQDVTENIILKMASHAKKITGSNNLCMAGGVALNCVSNSKLLTAKIFDNIFIQPAAGDAGGALGAALAAYHIFFDKDKAKPNPKNEVFDPYLGPEYSDIDAKKVFKKYKARYKYYNNFDDLSDKVADLINQGNIIGWFQGKMEWGPRALGNRSIIADARNKDMQLKLNLKVKYRESFRPFAPAVIEEDINNFFDFEGHSPYMIFVADVLQNRRNDLPDNYNSLAMKDKLYYKRSDVPAITHINFSARLQSVHKNLNKRFHQLIKNFKNKTDYGIVINTSFNVRGEPIVCTPDDAYRCFMNTEIDYLVVNNFLLDKKSQIAWPKEKSSHKYNDQYELD